MPTPLNFNGNDDNALEALVIDAGIAFTHSGNTHQAIDALAAVVVYDLPFQGNDRQMLEAIAANAVIEPPFVYKLDDDGTLAMLLGADGGLTMVAPDYLRGTKAITPEQRLWQLPADIADGAQVPAGELVAFEIIVNAAPYDAGMASNYLVGGGVAALNGAGGLINSIFIAYRVSGANVELRASGTGVDSIVIETMPAGSATGSRFGVWVDTTTGAVYIKTATNNYGQIAGASLAGIAKLLPWLGSYAEPGVTVVTGQAMDMELVTEAADMTLAYPVGTMDIYGDVI